MSVTANLTTNVETITATITVDEETITAEINTAARGPAGADGGGGGGGTWGSITGTLSSQTDLQSALDAKQPLSAVLTATTASFTTADETKLDGIATGATANSSDATLLARANHTGTQAHTTITGLGTLATQSATITDYLTIASASATYQPLDSGLTSWAGVTRASGFDTFAATPSSANLAALVTGETGSGALVFGTSPTLTTPVLGVASATSFSLAAGSVSAPSITFQDADSGFYAPTSTSIAYASDGAQKFRFDSAGMTLVSAGGAESRTLTVFDASTSFSAGLHGASMQAFGFGDIRGSQGTIGRFERNTSTGLISFQMQAASSASMTFNIGHASASFRVRAAASQTASIQEWRNSSESVLASVSAAGLGTFVGLTNTGAVSFNTGSTFSYGSGIAATHRTALGSTTTGDALFIAADMAAANLALGEIRSSASADVNATTQNVWVDTGASVALTTGTWRVVAFYHGANATSSATNVRLSASANWSDTNGRRIGTVTGGAVTAGPTFTTGGTSSAANFGTAGLVAGEIIAIVKMTGSGTLSMQVTNTAATGTATSYTGSHIVALKLD